MEGSKKKLVELFSFHVKVIGCSWRAWACVCECFRALALSGLCGGRTHEKSVIACEWNLNIQPLLWEAHISPDKVTAGHFKRKFSPMPLRSFHFYSHSHEIYFPFCFRSFHSLNTLESLWTWLAIHFWIKSWEFLFSQFWLFMSFHEQWEKPRIVPIFYDFPKTMAIPVPPALSRSFFFHFVFPRHSFRMG